VASRLGGILGAVLSGAATGVLLFSVGLLLTGHRMTTVLTGSMSPRLPVGALVVTERVPASAVRAGDVVVFTRPGHTDQTVIHRVVRITPTGAGMVQAHTRGDANSAEHPWILVVDQSAPVDRAITALPGVGHSVAEIRRFAIEGLLLLVGAWVVIGGLRRIWATAAARGYLPAPVIGQRLHGRRTRATRGEMRALLSDLCAEVSGLVEGEPAQPPRMTRGRRKGVS